MTAIYEPGSDEWLEARRSGIGGSDAANVCGVGYESPWEVYVDKRGERHERAFTDKQLSRMRWGQRMEDVIADAYAEETGRTVHRVNTMLHSKIHPFMLANIDRRVVNEAGVRRGLECKNVDYLVAKFGEEWGEGHSPENRAEASDLVPTVYYLQCQHYLMVTEWDAWDLAALVGGNDLRVYTITPDPTIMDMLARMEGAFWKCVQDGTPPAVSSMNEARLRFPNSVATKITATAEIVNAVAEFKMRKAFAKQTEGDIDTAQSQIAGFMGENDTLVGPDGKVLLTWKTSSRAGYTVAPTTLRTMRLASGK